VDVGVEVSLYVFINRVLRLVEVSDSSPGATISASKISLEV